MNHVLARLLLAMAMVDPPFRRRHRVLGAALERLADPRGRAVQLIVSVDDLYPDDYPLDPAHTRMAEDAAPGFGGLLERAFDLDLVDPLVPRLYTWTAERVEVPELARFQVDGDPCYPRLAP